jgi:serine/threonine-protein kinase RsbW
MTIPRARFMSERDWVFGGEAPMWKRPYTGSPENVERARDFAYLLFRGTGLEDDVRLIVSELATNAVEHTESGREGGWFGLQLRMGRLAYVAVLDQGGANSFPVVTRYPDSATVPLAELPESGRGLATVESLAYAFGSHGSLKGGLTVWAELLMSGNTDRKCEPLQQIAS